MEYFDIYDRDGALTGRTGTVRTVLKQGEFYLGVHVYIYCACGEFLIQRRSFNKSILPGVWDILMGHVRTGESSPEGVIREVFEEIGLLISEDDMKYAGRYIWEEYHHFADIYLVRIGNVRTEDLCLQTDEVIDVRYITKQEMTTFIDKFERPQEYKRIARSAVNSIITN